MEGLHRRAADGERRAAASNRARSCPVSSSASASFSYGVLVGPAPLPRSSLPMAWG